MTNPIWKGTNPMKKMRSRDIILDLTKNTWFRFSPCNLVLKAYPINKFQIIPATKAWMINQKNNRILKNNKVCLKSRASYKRESKGNKRNCSQRFLSHPEKFKKLARPNLSRWRNLFTTSEETLGRQWMKILFTKNK